MRGIIYLSHAKFGQTEKKEKKGKTGERKESVPRVGGARGGGEKKEGEKGRVCPLSFSKPAGKKRRKRKKEEVAGKDCITQVSFQRGRRKGGGGKRNATYPHVVLIE